MENLDKALKKEIIYDLFSEDYLDTEEFNYILREQGLTSDSEEIQVHARLESKRRLELVSGLSDIIKFYAKEFDNTEYFMDITTRDVLTTFLAHILKSGVLKLGKLE